MPATKTSITRLHFLPYPIPTGDGHYLKDHRPSIPKSPKPSHLWLVFSMLEMLAYWLSVKNATCGVYSSKLSHSGKQELDSLLSDYTFTCGASLSDLGLSRKLGDVCVRKLGYFDLASYPGPLRKLRAWYPLFTHAPIT